MGKTRRNSRNQYYRSFRGHKKVMIEKESVSGIRHKAIPPQPWYDIHVQRECRIPYKAAENMMKKGWNREKIIHHLVKKFGFSYSIAREYIPWDMTRNDDYTYKPL